MRDLMAIDSFVLTEHIDRSEVLVLTSPPQADDDTATALGSFVTGAEEEKHRFRVLDGCGPEQEPLD